MAFDYKKKNVPLSQRLRREMTKEEKHLWYDFLKYFPVTVHRQKNIGKYIVDFYVAEFKLVIELDGSQHGHEENWLADQERDAYLKSLGLRVVRYSNSVIKTNFEGVCSDILFQCGLPPEKMKHKW